MVIGGRNRFFRKLIRRFNVSQRGRGRESPPSQSSVVAPRAWVLALQPPHQIKLLCSDDKPDDDDDDDGRFTARSLARMGKKGETGIGATEACSLSASHPGARRPARPPHLFIIIKEAGEGESDGGEWIICSIGEMGPSVPFTAPLPLSFSSRSPTTKPCHYPSHNRTERTSEQASERGKEEGTRERGEEEGGRRAAIGLIRHNVVVVPRYSARPPDRWNTLRRGGGRGYRQLESWHQTTMGGGEEGEEKKPDGRATAAKCLLVQSASRPPSLYTILDRRYSPSSKASPPSKISSGFDS